MALIIQIEKIRRKYKVVTDDGETFWVPWSLFQERPLSLDAELDAEEYDRWLMLRMYRAGLHKSVDYLATRAHSSGEIRQKLLRCGYRPATIDMILTKLSMEHLLDDEAFCRQWVTARCSKGIGKKKIMLELKQKGIDHEMIDTAIEACDDGEQLLSAIRIAQKSYSKRKPEEERQKTYTRVMGTLLRKGFSPGIARNAMEKVMQQE